MRASIRSANRGQSLVEFALVLPLLLLLLVGIFDLGYAVFTDNMLENAAREGARTGVILGKSDGDIRIRVRAAAPGLDLRDDQIAISPSARAFNSPITVTVSYNYIPITPFVGRMAPGGFQLSATSAMIVEGVLNTP